MSTPLIELGYTRLDDDLKKQAIRLGYILYRYRNNHGKTDVYEYAMTYASIKQAIQENKRTRNAMRQLDRDINLADDLTRERGTCPHCHLVLPFNGVCECGYVKPTKTDVAGVYAKYARKTASGKPYQSKKPQALKITNKYAKILSQILK